MTLSYFKELLHAGLPIWIITGGGLLCLFFDALIKKGIKIVYGVGALVFIPAIWVASRQFLKGEDLSKDLLLLDPLNLFFICFVLVIGFLSLCNTYAYVQVRENQNDDFSILLKRSVVSLLLFCLVGIIFLFASDHLMVNFIGLETMSLALYLLVGSYRKDVRSNEGAMKYFVMGSVASAILLYGIALLYGSLGTFHLSHLAFTNPETAQIVDPRLAVMLIFFGLLFKLAIVPFHFWAPDAYEGAPTPFTGFMATAVKVGVFALFIRVIGSLGWMQKEIVTLLQVCVVLTLLVGNLGAIVQDNVKRMLAYSSIAHAGYLVLGILVGFKDGIFLKESLSAVIFYLVGYSLTTLGAFAVLSVMVSDQKEKTQFSDLAGLGFKRPVLAASFSLFMLSLLGIPPTVGFVAKYGIFAYAIKNGYVGLAVFGIITSLVSAYYYLRPLVVMYFQKESSPDNTISLVPLPLMFSIVFCAAAVIYLGIQPTPYLKMALMAIGVISQ